MADRAIYTETLGYSDVEDDDLERYAEARGVTDRAALKEILRHFSATSANPAPVRSLRRLSDAIGEALYDAGGGPVTAETIGAHLKGLARAA